MEDHPYALPNRWTAIAERPRVSDGTGFLEWRELPGAPLKVPDAHLLRASDIILMANRHFEDRVELVVRPTIPTLQDGAPDVRRARNRRGAKRRRQSMRFLPDLMRPSSAPSRAPDTSQ
jgi:hypothetical protein